MNILGYYIGVSALGLVIGYLIALSASPVVGTLLPLLFSCLGGAGAVYAAKLNLQNPNERARLNMAGLSLACFALALLASASWTLGARDRLPSLPLRDSKSRTTAQVEHALQLAKLRRQLQLLGSADGEIARILEAAPAPETAAMDDAAKMAEKALSIAEAVGPIRARMSPGAVADADLKGKIEKLMAAMSFVEQALPETAKRLKSTPDVASRLLNFQVNYLTHMTQQLTGGNETSVWNITDYERLGFDTALLSALLETRAVLEVYRIRFAEQTVAATFFKGNVSPGEQQVFPWKGAPPGLFAHIRRDDQ